MYRIYIYLFTIACYITYALSEQQKINSGFFLYEAEQKAKKAKKNIAEIRIRQQTKMHGKNVSRQNILAAHSSEESDFMDDSL